MPRIFLTGFSYTGKTETARLVAQRLGWPCIDTDDLIVKKAGKLIHRIFAEDGEARFRELEREAIAEACEMDDAVVATGGYIGRVLQKVPALVPLIGKAEEIVAKVGATQFGRSLAFLNKWIPLLNVAWVVMAGKTALDVHHDSQASARSKTLSLVALGASAAVFGAGVLLGPWAFAGITAASIGADLALAYSRKRDAQATA